MAGLVTKDTTEDWLLFLVPFLTGSGGTAVLQLAGLVPGLSGFAVGASIGALSKALVGLGQNPKLANWEDWLLFVSVFLGYLSAAFANKPELVAWGTIIGFIAKALPSLKDGINPEDVLLLLGSIIAGVGLWQSNAILMNFGILLSVAGKSLPSIITEGQAGRVSRQPTAPVPGPPAV
jgi:hypothetical protein